mgnify:CR=1 FL=1
MNMQQYQKLAVGTEVTNYSKLAQNFSSRFILRLIHAAMGITTETGEFMSTLKKHVIYDVPLDKVNLIEELGDLLWYITIAIDALGTDMEDIMVRNIANLHKRYPKAFNTQDAALRNLQQERDALLNPKYNHGK